MKFLVLFRGINVGGKNIVKMAALKKMLSGMGLQDVKTYIQSGNAIFDSDGQPDIVKRNIEENFKSSFGFESRVILRTEEEVANIITMLPFSQKELEAAVAANPAVEHLYFYFMDSALQATDITALETGYDGPDRVLPGTKGLYLLCYESVRNSKLAVMLTRMDIPMTARNWKTVNKLYSMMKE